MPQAVWRQPLYPDVGARFVEPPAVFWRANNFNGEVRAITSSSIDLPTLVLPQVVALDRPKRAVDVLVNRQEVPSNSFEFWQQTVRTNNAAFVAVVPPAGH